MSLLCICFFFPLFCFIMLLCWQTVILFSLIPMCKNNNQPNKKGIKTQNSSAYILTEYRLLFFTFSHLCSVLDKNYPGPHSLHMEVSLSKILNPWNCIFGVCLGMIGSLLLMSGWCPVQSLSEWVNVDTYYALSDQ